MKLYNQRNNTVIADKLIIADKFFSRLRGLMFTASLPAGEAMLISPCNSIHTFFMRFPIDIIFLDLEFRVISMITALKPNRVSPVIKKSRHVLELPAGTIDKLNVNKGDQLKIDKKH